MTSVSYTSQTGSQQTKRKKYKIVKLKWKVQGSWDSIGLGKMQAKLQAKLQAKSRVVAVKEMADTIYSFLESCIVFENMCASSRRCLDPHDTCDNGWMHRYLRHFHNPCRKKKASKILIFHVNVSNRSNSDDSVIVRCVHESKIRPNRSRSVRVDVFGVLHGLLG